MPHGPASLHGNRNLGEAFSTGPAGHSTMLARVNALRVPYTVPPSTAAARLPVHCEHHDGPGTASEGDSVE